MRPTPALETKNERYRKQLTHFEPFHPSVVFHIKTSHLFSIWNVTPSGNGLSQCSVSIPPENILKTSGFVMFSEVTEMGIFEIRECSKKILKVNSRNKIEKGGSDVKI